MSATDMRLPDATSETTTTWAERARTERTREQTARRKAQRRARRVEAVPRLVDAGVLFVLLALAASAHGAVFGGASGYVAAIGGVAVGAVCALLAKQLKVGVWGSALILIFGYLLAGGVLALPSTTWMRVFPTLRTLQMLVVGSVTSWKDLLTVQPPAGSFVGPAVMPYVAATLASFAALTIVLRTRRPMWALVPVALLLLTGVLWGSQNAPEALAIGVVSGVLSIAWAAIVSMRMRRSGARGTVEFANSSERPGPRRLVGAMVLLAIGGVAAGGLTPALLDDPHRFVIRDMIEPPVDLQQYHSPISLFRSLKTERKDEELFTVQGLQAGDRVRLATLDLYDGTVFQISGDSREAGFRRVGSQFTDQPLNEGEHIRNLEFDLEGWSSNWVPGGGDALGLTAVTDGKDGWTESLYFSPSLGTLLSTTAPGEGDSYIVTQVAEHQWSDAELEGRAISQIASPSDTNVPSAVAEIASAMVGDANAGIQQVRAIQQSLHDAGFYSDGTDGLSLPGHRADRINRLLSDDQMIGDDDQYAPTMALLLRSLGVPSRVVVGFYPEDAAATDGAVTITGADTHAWVEVPFAGAGWVAFDPTPPEDQTPQTQVPQPKPTPRPQVLQPPDPPEEPAEVPPDVVDQPDNDKEPNNGWLDTLMLALRVLSGAVIVVAPFALIVFTKAHRSRRRRTRGTEDRRIAGAWDEVVDRATDLGVNVPKAATRGEQARSIDVQLPGSHPVDEGAGADSGFRRWDTSATMTVALASRLDSAIFGEDMPDAERRSQAWAEQKSLVASLRKNTSRRRRVQAIFSTRSLRARSTSLRDRWLAQRQQRTVASGMSAPIFQRETVPSERGSYGNDES